MKHGAHTKKSLKENQEINRLARIRVTPINTRETYRCKRNLKVEKMNMRQENHEEGQETKDKIEPQKESETILLQVKETMNDQRDIILSEILKEKECIESRIGDFDIDYVLDAKTQVKIMPESTWEILGKLAMIPSLGGIGLFKGSMITLCGRLTHVPMSAHGASTEE
jgi:hypothetical protein